MNSFADTLAAVNAMKADGVVEEYAVAEAMAMLFWAEPVPTLDLDVLVFMPPSDRPLVNLEPIYTWAASRGYPSIAEHIVIADVPTRPWTTAVFPSRSFGRSTSSLSTWTRRRRRPSDASGQPRSWNCPR